MSAIITVAEFKKQSNNTYDAEVLIDTDFFFQVRLLFKETIQKVDIEVTRAQPIAVQTSAEPEIKTTQYSLEIKNKNVEFQSLNFPCCSYYNVADLKARTVTFYRKIL